ncbi:MAG: hypothetical protein WC248_05015 [Candidatus Methanomethylophilaceae archaeon]|jgi:hypothetical protein
MNWGDVVNTILCNFAIPVMTAFVLGLIGVAIATLKKKWGLELSEQTETAIKSAAKVAVLAMEEKAAAYAVNQAGKITGAEKFATVVNELIGKFPTLTEKQAEKYANAAIAVLPGIGATGESKGAM